MTHQLRILGASLVLFGAAASDARTWNVRLDGTGDAQTIQAAIDSAGSGDSVIVGTGIYWETLRMFEKNLALLGEGADHTIVDAGQRASVLSMRSGIVSGLTLRNGATPGSGGGIFIGAAATAVIRQNIIEGNSAGHAIDSGQGGGVFVSPDVISVIIERNTIRYNSVGNAGGGIYASGRTEIRQNVIFSNYAYNFGGGIWTAGGNVRESIFVSNSSQLSAAALAIDGTGSRIERNTFFGNSVGQPTGSTVATTGLPVEIRNNIFANNHSIFPGGSMVGLFCENALVQCNDIWGNDQDAIQGAGNTTVGNFSLDPQFCATNPSQSLNFALQSDSPCAPGNSPAVQTCGLVGAVDVGCRTISVTPASWSEVKRLYRGPK